MATTIDSLVPPDQLDCEVFIRECAERHVRIELNDAGLWRGYLGGVCVGAFGIDKALARSWQSQHRAGVERILRDALVLLGYAEELPAPPKPTPIPRDVQRKLVDEGRAAMAVPE